MQLCLVDKMTFRKLLAFACSAGQKQARWRALYHIGLFEPHPWASANTDRTRKWMALSEKLSLILIPFHTSLFPLPRKSESCTKNCTIEILPPQSLSKLQLDMVDFAGPLCCEDLELLQSASITFKPKACFTAAHIYLRSHINMIIFFLLLHAEFLLNIAENQDNSLNICNIEF